MTKQATTEDELVYDGTPLVVCFTNPVSCAPCKALAPHFGALAGSELADHVDFLEVNVLEHMDLALGFDVMGTPTLVYIDGNGTKILHERSALRLAHEISTLLGS